MPPRFDPNEAKILVLRTVGGEVGSSATLSPKDRSTCLSPEKVGDDIAKATQDWECLYVTVKLTIQNRQAAISVVLLASALLIKALKEPPRDRKEEKNIRHNDNLSLDDIIEIARTMCYKSLARKLEGNVKEIFGTAFSIGCTVDDESPKDISDKIEESNIEIPGN
jgi:large subunit ribosomal protein L12e